MSCEDCQRLRREFAAATLEEIGLNNKRKIAILKRDTILISFLTPRVEAAAKAREAARQGLRLHEHAVHGKANKAAEDSVEPVLQADGPQLPRRQGRGGAGG